MPGGKFFFLFLSPPARMVRGCQLSTAGLFGEFFLRVLVDSFDSVDNECLFCLVCISIPSASVCRSCPAYQPNNLEHGGEAHRCMGLLARAV